MVTKIQLKPHARRLRHAQTDVEQKLWFFLRNRQILNYKFRRQYIIDSYIVDFCCTEKKLVIELDGSQHLINKTKDEKRDRVLNEKGYKTLRFWDHEVLKETKSVLERIRLELMNPHPDPLPGRERENMDTLPKRDRE